jgi:hypothetical protein
MQLWARTVQYITKRPEGQPGRQCIHRTHHRLRHTDSDTVKRWHTLLAVCLLAAHLLPVSRAQGLVAPAFNRVGATANQLGALTALYASSKAVKLAYQSGATTACSRRSGSLCAPSSGDKGLTQLLVATSPVAYDSRNIAQVGNTGTSRRGDRRGPWGVAVYCTLLRSGPGSSGRKRLKKVTSAACATYFVCV